MHLFGLEEGYCYYVNIIRLLKVFDFQISGSLTWILALSLVNLCTDGCSTDRREPSVPAADTMPRHLIKQSFLPLSFVFLKVILRPSVVILSALVASPGFGRANTFSKSLIMIRIICHCSARKLRLVCRDVCLLMRF